MSLRLGVLVVGEPKQGVQRLHVIYTRLIYTYTWVDGLGNRVGGIDPPEWPIDGLAGGQGLAGQLDD